MSPRRRPGRPVADGTENGAAPGRTVRVLGLVSPSSFQGVSRRAVCAPQNGTGPCSVPPTPDIGPAFSAAPVLGSPTGTRGPQHWALEPACACGFRSSYCDANAVSHRLVTYSHASGDADRVHTRKYEVFAVVRCRPGGLDGFSAPTPLTGSSSHVALPLKHADTNSGTPTLPTPLTHPPHTSMATDLDVPGGSHPWRLCDLWDGR